MQKYHESCQMYRTPRLKSTFKNGNKKPTNELVYFFAFFALGKVSGGSFHRNIENALWLNLNCFSANFSCEYRYWTYVFVKVHKVIYAIS